MNIFFDVIFYIKSYAQSYDGIFLMLRELYGGRMIALAPGLKQCRGRQRQALIIIDVNS